MRPRIETGELAVVIGDGLVGQWTGQTLARRGARVVLTGRHEDRLAKFRAGGWGETLRVAGDGAAEVAAHCRDDIAVLVDTVGNTAFYDAYLPRMKHGGTIVSAGFYGTSDAIEIQRYRFKELAFDLCAGIRRDRVDATIARVAAGDLDTRGLITHTFPVERAAEAWELIESKREPVLGVVLEWNNAQR